MPRTGGTATRRRILAQAVRAFGRDGYAETSLDGVAAAVGIRKQSLLYHFPTKEGLFTEAASVAAARVAAALDRALRPEPIGLQRLDALVDAGYQLARRRPEILPLLREATRLGPPMSDGVARAMRPLIDAAVEWLQRSMDSGLVRRQNPRVALLAIYSAVVGSLTESAVTDVMLADTGRLHAQAELVAFLHAALAPEPAWVRGASGGPRGAVRARPRPPAAGA